MAVEAMLLCVRLSILALVLALVDSSALACPDRCECDQPSLTVNCSYAGLTAVPTGLPAYVKVLDLSNNQLTSLPPGAFSLLPALGSLDLSNNQMTDDVLQAGTFTAVKQLDLLDLSNNQLTRIPHHLPRNITTLLIISNKIEYLDDLSGLGSVGRLDLDYNGIYKMAAHVFENVTSLTQLGLWFNAMTPETLPRDVFTPLTELRVLGFRFNDVEHIPARLPASLVGLDMVSVGLTSIPKGPLNHLCNLDNLAFWQNQVTHIEDGAFMGLEKLTLLDAMTNNMTSITSRTFQGLTSLKTLYLEENLITSIQPGAFDWFRAPAELWLSGNRISTFDASFESVFTAPSLNLLDITFNPLICDCTLAWLKRISEKLQTIQSPHLITCAGPPSVAGKSWDQLTHLNFTCSTH